MINVRKIQPQQNPEVVELVWFVDEDEDKVTERYSLM
jgi:hypothetical protein